MVADGIGGTDGVVVGIGDAEDRGAGEDPGTRHGHPTGQRHGGHGGKDDLICRSIREDRVVGGFRRFGLEGRELGDVVVRPGIEELGDLRDGVVIDGADEVVHTARRLAGVAVAHRHGEVGHADAGHRRSRGIIAQAGHDADRLAALERLL